MEKNIPTNKNQKTNSQNGKSIAKFWESYHHKNNFKGNLEPYFKETPQHLGIYEKKKRKSKEQIPNSKIQNPTVQNGVIRCKNYRDTITTTIPSTET